VSETPDVMCVTKSWLAEHWGEAVGHLARGGLVSVRQNLHAPASVVAELYPPGWVALPPEVRALMDAGVAELERQRLSGKRAGLERALDARMAARGWARARA